MTNEYEEIHLMVERIFREHFEEAVVGGSDDAVDVQQAIDDTTAVIRERVDDITTEAVAMREEQRTELKAEIKGLVDEVLADAKAELKKEMEEFQTAKKEAEDRAAKAEAEAETAKKEAEAAKKEAETAKAEAEAQTAQAEAEQAQEEAEEAREEVAQEQQGLWSRFIDRVFASKGKYVLFALTAILAVVGGRQIRNSGGSTVKLDGVDPEGDFDAPNVVLDGDVHMAA